MKTKKINFLDWNNNVFISSMKRVDLNIIFIIFLDIIFYISSWYLISFWLQRIQEKVLSFNLPSQEEIISLGYQKATQMAAEAKSFYYLLIISALLLTLAIIFLASIIKGIIWAKTTNTKITLALLSKFLGLNLAWISFWLGLILLVSIFVDIHSALSFMVITIAIGLYFTNTLYSIFMQNPSFKAIGPAIKLNFSKIRWFLLPYILIFLGLFIIFMLNGVFVFPYSVFVFQLIAVIYSAFVRYYSYQLVLEAGKI